MSKKTTKKRKAVELFSTDQVAKDIFWHLMRDFRRVEGQQFALSAEKALKAGVKTYREYSYPELGFISAHRYKRWVQLSSLFKKYRFTHDLYTDDELVVRTRDKFLSVQEFLAAPREYTPLQHVVLQKARKITKQILGDFDPEEVINCGRFGTKSSIGCPLSLAYLDEKLSDARHVTSSSDCARWFFRDYLPGDPVLSVIFKKLGYNITPGGEQPSCFEEDLAHDSLNYVQVPKNWKIHRGITPLTLLSLFYSFGIGGVIEDRLRGIGLDIRTLQQRHRKLVEKNSKSRFLTTADLSSASDSLCSSLLNRVLPRRWYVELKKTFTHRLFMDDELVYTESVLPMGNGATFPVETLVFYSLLKAIAELTSTKGTISVYGDDLIYPRKMHRYVAVIFPSLRLKLNAEKTYSASYFRESCGADFYRGADVRPFILPDGGTFTRTQFMAWLYKVMNGLQRRWDRSEIEYTWTFLLRYLSIVGVDRAIYRVPPSFPDNSGIRCSCPSALASYSDPFINWAPVSVTMTGGSRWFTFTYLRQTAAQRWVKQVEPYYWLSLQGRTDEPRDADFWEIDYSSWCETPMPYLQWHRIKKKVSYKKGSRKCTVTRVKIKGSVGSRVQMGFKPTTVMPPRHSSVRGKTGPVASDWI